jgi:hypothetical protein
MAHLVKLGYTMSIRYPEMRARLREAVDALCDSRLQERLWLHGERRSSSELGFDDTLLFLVDEMEMFRSDDLVGDVLVDGSELTAFSELVAAVERLIRAIGKQGSFADALAAGSPWESSVMKAREMQRLMTAADHSA